MKTKSTVLALLSLFLINNTYADDCLDFSDLTQTPSYYNNDGTFPVGSAFMTSGSLQLIKNKSANWSGYFDQTTVLSVSDTDMYWHGYLLFDVSSAAYSCRTLIVEGSAEKIIFGNDTIVTYNVSYPYSGAGYTIDTLNWGTYKITGSFNEVQFWIPTGILRSACLSDCSTASGCMNFALMNQTANYNNDTTYPSGSVLHTAGPLQLIKTSSSIWSGGMDQTLINGVTDTNLWYHGDLTFDVSNAPYICRKLSFYTTSEFIVVDGDTIMSDSINLVYTGSNYQVEMSPYYNYIITGDFDQVDVYANTGLLDFVCLDSCSTVNQGCLDLTQLDQSNPYNNDTIYPAGSVLLTSGSLALIKTSNYDWNPNWQQTVINAVTDSTILFHGYLGLDVSTSSSTCRDLYINAYAERIIVDGDTIQLSGTSLPYAGVGFTVDTLSFAEFQITGNFNNVTIWAPTSIFFGACFDSCAGCYASFTYTSGGSVVTFTNTSSVSSFDADQFFWDFGDGTSSTIDDPVHTYANIGIYVVCLTIVDFDCPNPTMQYCDTIIVSNCPATQTVISPDGDGEYDNVLLPKGARVYDRYGYQVLEVKQDLLWDGSDGNGDALPMGMYTVFCDQNKVSNVTVVR